MTLRRFVLAMTALVPLMGFAGCGDKDRPEPQLMAKALGATGRGVFATDPEETIVILGPCVLEDGVFGAQLTERETEALAATGMTKDQFDKGIQGIYYDNEYRRSIIGIFKANLRQRGIRAEAKP